MPKKSNTYSRDKAIMTITSEGCKQPVKSAEWYEPIFFLPAGCVCKHRIGEIWEGNCTC